MSASSGQVSPMAVPATEVHPIAAARLRRRWDAVREVSAMMHPRKTRRPTTATACHSQSEGLPAKLVVDRRLRGNLAGTAPSRRWRLGRVARAREGGLERGVTDLRRRWNLPGVGAAYDVEIDYRTKRRGSIRQRHLGGLERLGLALVQGLGAEVLDEVVEDPVP